MSIEEFRKYHEVDLLDFQKYIESIGFVLIVNVIIFIIIK